MASLPRNPPDCIILDNLLFDNLISVHKLFAKALPIFATCLLVNNNSCEKLILLSELSIIFDDNLKTTSVFLCVSVCVCVCVCVFLQTLIYQAANLIVLHLNYYIVLFYIGKK